MPVFRFRFDFKKALVLWWMVYFAAALINLDTLPIAWIDEVQLADVGRNLAETGRMFSKIWGLPGTETVFLAYPPFVIFYHAFWQFFLPEGIFWTRLPFLLAFPVSLFFLHKIFIQFFKLNEALCALLLIFFSIDRGIYESLRSYRVEVLELALLAPALYYFLMGKKSVLVALLCTLLALCHLSLLPLALLLWLFNFYKNPNWRSVVVSLIPPLLWLAINGFNFPELFNQMFALGGEHTPGGNRFYNHFVGRFFPFYNTQPLVPLLFWLAHPWCLYSIWRKRSLQSSIMEVLFIATSAYWFFMLGPFYRYNTPIILLMLVMLAEILSKSSYFSIQKKVWLPALYLLLPLAAWFPRNAVALAERPQRDIYNVYSWLDEVILPDSGKVLLIGQPAAWYYAQKYSNVEYTSIYAVRNFRFDEFSGIYYLPDAGRAHAGTPMATLTIESYFVLPEQIRGITYSGSKIFKVESDTVMRAIQAQYAW